MSGKNKLAGIILITSIALSILFLPATNAATNQDIGQWTTMAPMPTARSGLGLAVVYNKIYAIGGLIGNNTVNIVEEYNPETNNWTTKAPMPTARTGFGIAVYNNKIYVIGGDTGNGFTANNEVYNPLTDTWEQKYSMSIPRSDLDANVVNGKIYVIGGKNYTSAYPHYIVTDINEVYDPTTDTWSRQANMPIAVEGYASTVVGGKIYVIGGVKLVNNATELVDANQIYDAQTNQWSFGANQTSITSYSAAGATVGEMAPVKIHVIGGCSMVEFSNKTETYDPTTNTWTQSAQMPTARAYFGLAVVNDALYAIGGYNGRSLNTNEKFTPAGYGHVLPVLQIVTPQNRTYRDVNLTYTSSKQVLSWVGYSLDEQANVTADNEAREIALPSLPDGQHQIVIYANDTLGNMGASSIVYFLIDKTAPQIVILSPQNQSYNSPDVQLTFFVSENGTYAYSIDGRDNVSIAGNITLPEVPQGQHHLTVYCTDEFGNNASATIFFTVTSFPLIWAVAVTAVITIVLAATYLVLLEKKKIK